jgi:phosphoribosylformimino-5-aminoimidazole carboxamide ribotide isomerase
LRNGRCVRLYQGDYNRETIFNDSPLEVAMQWQSLGAPRIHIVDLDGAASGEVTNLEVIENIATAVLVPTQLGGGIRSIEIITKLLNMGIERVILGTVAVENKELVEQSCRKYPDSIIVSIDAREGQVATRGWLKGTELNAVQLAQEMACLGVRRFIYTDISRDGTLSGPNFPAIKELIDALGLPVIAAGGISNIADLRILKSSGAEGAIIGKALYTGDINLKEALEVSQ